jgi:hypothetical protein
MISIAIVEDNIHKIHKLVNKEYEKWGGKTILITGYQTEFERQLAAQGGRQLEILYLDYELSLGAGDGLSILHSLTPSVVQKVVGITFNREVMRKFFTICKEKGIEFEACGL